MAKRRRRTLAAADGSRSDGGSASDSDASTLSELSSAHSPGPSRPILAGSAITSICLIRRDGSSASVPKPIRDAGHPSWSRHPLQRQQNQWNTGPFTLETLPAHAVGMLVPYIGIRGLCALRSVSVAMRSQCSSDTLWRRMYLERFGDDGWHARSQAGTSWFDVYAHRHAAAAALARSDPGKTACVPGANSGVAAMAGIAGKCAVVVLHGGTVELRGARDRWPLLTAAVSAAPAALTRRRRIGLPATPVSVTGVAAASFCPHIALATGDTDILLLSRETGEAQGRLVVPTRPAQADPIRRVAMSRGEEMGSFVLAAAASGIERIWVWEMDAHDGAWRWYGRAHLPFVADSVALSPGAATCFVLGVDNRARSVEMAAIALQHGTRLWEGSMVLDGAANAMLALSPSGDLLAIASGAASAVVVDSFRGPGNHGQHVLKIMPLLGGTSVVKCISWSACGHVLGWVCCTPSTDEGVPDTGSVVCLCSVEKRGERYEFGIDCVAARLGDVSVTSLVLDAADGRSLVGTTGGLFECRWS